MVSLVRVCGNGHLTLGQGELGAQIRRILNFLPISPCVHPPGKGGEVDLLLQRGNPTVEMDHHSVSAVRVWTFRKGMSICGIL